MLRSSVGYKILTVDNFQLCLCNKKLCATDCDVNDSSTTDSGA